MRIADILGLGILLRWKDKASTQMKKAERTVDNLGDAADEATEKTARLEAGFKKLGKAGAYITAFGIAGAVAFYGLARTAGTFEDTLRDTMTMTGLTGEAFEKMESELGEMALSMSTKFGMAASEINKSFYQVLSAGAAAGTKQFEALSESALMLAKVVGMEPAAAVESLSDALHSFEMDVAAAERMADVFFKTSMLGATTVPQMADAMKEASKVAVELKLPLEDVAAVLTGFASKGIKGAEAGTAFRMMMTKLAAPMGGGEKALASLGVAIYDVTTKEMRPLIGVLKDLKFALGHVTHQEREMMLKAIAGEEAFAKLGGLLATDLTILEAWSKELKAGGVLQVAFEQKTRTLNFAMSAMRESLRNVAIVLGQHLLPMVTPVAKAIARLSGRVREFLAAHPKLAKTAVIFGAIATAAALIIGPLVTLAGMIGAFGGVSAILAAIKLGFVSLYPAVIAVAIPFIKIIAVAALVAGVAYLLYKAWQKNLGGMQEIVSAVWKVVSSFYKGVWEGVKAAFIPLIGTFKEAWASLSEAIAPLIEVGREFAVMLGLTTEGASGLEGFADVAKMVGKVVGFVLVTPMKLMLTYVAYLIKGYAWLLKGAQKLGFWLGGKLAPHFGTIKKVILYLLGPIGMVILHFGKIRKAVGAAIEWISGNWGMIKDVMLAPIDFILEGWAKLTEGLTGFFTSIRDTVTDAFKSIRDSISASLDWVWNKITWVISNIPDVFLPESLEKLKRGVATGAGTPGTTAAATPVSRSPIAGQLVVPATAPAVQRAAPRPTIPREAFAMPALAMAGAAAGPVDQSINIGPGAIVIHATRIDERTAMQIDRELARLIERRRERR